VIGLDTNVLVRYMMQDDPRQSARATRLIDSLSAEEPGFVPLVAVVELVWVLSGSYGLARAQVATALEALLRSKELLIDRAALVSQAVSRYAISGADFADALIERIAAAKGCAATMTFDAGAVKASAMTLVP
jgi:predicted nucleic-acid-binding protein